MFHLRTLARYLLASAALILPAHPSQLPTLTSVAQIRKLSPAEARRGYPVHVRGVLTYYDPASEDCFLDDGTAGVWVDAGTVPRPMRAGDLADVRGRTNTGSFVAEIQQPEFRVLGRAAFPKPHPVPYLDLSSAEWDSQWVEVRDQVRTAEYRSGRLLLWLAPSGHRFPINLPAAAGTPEQFVGAVVRAQGVCGARMDEQSRTVGFQLEVPGIEQLAIEEPASKNLWQGQQTTITELLQFAGVRDPSRQLRIRGVVNLQLPGHAVFLTDGTKALSIQTLQRTPARPGDVLDVTGFAVFGENGAFLEDAIYRVAGHTSAPHPVKMTAQQALDTAADASLVEIEARLLSRADAKKRHVLALRSADMAFVAELPVALAVGSLSKLRDGSLLRVTGVCQIRSEHPHQQGSDLRLLLRSMSDIAVIEEPSWLTVERAILILLLMGIAILGSAVWAAMLGRRVRAQTAIIHQKLDAEALLEKRYSDLVENANDMIYTRDLEGFFTAINPAGERMIGYTREEALGMNLTELIPPEHRPAARARVQATISQEDEKPYEVEIIRKDGQRRMLEFSPHLIKRDGRPLRVEGIVRDITERMRVQAEFERAKEMAEAANRAKSEFLANMSHEVRTPMNGVIGVSELVLATGLTTEQREYVETIQACAESLLGVINDILDFSKIEARKLELDSAKFDIRKLTAEVSRTMRMRMDEKGLVLHTAVAGEVPERLVGDPYRLRQILVNLIGNAVKFTDRGSISVDITLEHRAGADCVLRFAVRDTGVGIPREKQGAIFRPFEQADGSSSRRHGGTGLGLAICAQLAMLMRGAIWLESEVGQGSTFYFTAELGIPEHTTAEVEAPPAPAAEPVGSLNVLVVEDNAVNRMIAVRLLEMRGHRAEVASDGQEALKAVASRRFDLILMDIQMPEMDGFQATAAIRRQEAPGQRVPILALTAHAMKGDRERCLDAGMDGYLSKPVQAAELCAAIENAMVTGRPLTS